MEQLFFNLLTFMGENVKIETSLFGTLEDDCHGTILLKVVIIIINFLLGGVIIGGTIGMIISGLQILTARDDAGAVTKGKKRLIDIAIGIGVFALMYVVLNFIIPGGVTLNSDALASGETCPEPPTTTTTTPPPEGGEPTEPTEPPTGGPGGCKGNTVENGGYCYAKTKVMAYDYVKNACSHYHTCQSYKSSEWGSKCAQVATMNAGEMMNGFSKVHYNIESTGAHYSTYNESAPANEDNVAMLMCNGSLSRATTKPGASSINRKAFKRAVKTIVTEIEAGHPITIAVGVKRRGTWTDARNRHFVTIVGYTSALNSGNVDSATVEFESGDCINSGKAGRPEPWDQPIVTVNGTQIKFRYVDPWGANLGTLGDAGSRDWRLHYDTTGWYFYRYR
jgi:hypothetical protein